MRILFDLDGTLTDSAEGILNSVRLVYDRFGLTLPEDDELRSFIGPPLEVSFPKHGIPPERVQEAIGLFRSRYIPIGKYENHPYPGIRELLDALLKAGHVLFVATSKPQETAIEILSHFRLDSYFTGICGATKDSSRVSKSQVIRYLLEQYPDDHSPAVMIGDTEFDVIGASEFGIPTICVSWGYGSRNAIEAAGPLCIVDTPDQILQALEQLPNHAET